MSLSRETGLKCVNARGTDRSLDSHTITNKTFEYIHFNVDGLNTNMRVYDYVYVYGELTEMSPS
jgi:hypothetical protein